MLAMTHFITDCLSAFYRIEAINLALLPVGADINASIYKVKARDQKTYFVKLRRGHSHDVSIAILEFLQRAGNKQLIVPIQTVDGKLHQQAGDFTFIVYPFVEGQDGFSRTLTDEQWITLGRALRQIHEVDVPASLANRIRQEDFSPKWRDYIRSLYARAQQMRGDHEVASNLWKFHQENRTIIERLVERAEHFSQKISSQPLEFVLCHADIHAGNVLVDDKEVLYIVDWDDPILAPKERDLMFIGGGVGNVWNKPHEEKLFYRGYGQINVDWTLLTYYRYERIVEDIAVYTRELLQPTSSKNSLEMYEQFMSQFVPRGVVDIAFETDKYKVAHPNLPLRPRLFPRREE